MGSPPVTPPVGPMLGRLARDLPAGEFVYEPKWDGFRCLAFRFEDVVDLRSRNDKPLARYFPEIVEALAGGIDRPAVLDGELVATRDGAFESAARAMVKVKHGQTADCVVAGCRLRVDAPVIGSLLLGLYDDAGELRHVGVSSAFSAARRRELLEELAPYVTRLE